jgi:RNA-directed DNA polymerase
VHGTRDDVEALHEAIASVLEPLDLRLSPAKTRVVHMSEKFDFLRLRIQWRRKRGTNKWYVCTFIAETDRPVRSVKDKVRALTSRLLQQPLRDVLIRLNQIMRGWANASATSATGAALAVPGDTIAVTAATDQQHIRIR